jgi:hypothetical protein
VVNEKRWNVALIEKKKLLVAKLKIKNLKKIKYNEIGNSMQRICIMHEINIKS